MGVPLRGLLTNTGLTRKLRERWSPPSECLAVFPSVLMAVLVQTSGE